MPKVASRYKELFLFYLQTDKVFLVPGGLCLQSCFTKFLPMILQAEGIFRINPENSQEEHVRNQLNRGNVPDDIDVHCLAGLIKAWFRELPSGVLDGLSPEQVLQCNTEEESVELVKQLKPTETALLNWAVDLMADVVEHEESNKMNARNIAMVFSPNMTQVCISSNINLFS